MESELNFTIHPLHNYVLIRALTRQKTEGGIHLPENSRVAESGLKVVAIGSGVKEKIKPGDLVIVGGTVRTVKDENGATTEFALVVETDILAIKKKK